AERRRRPPHLGLAAFPQLHRRGRRRCDQGEGEENLHLHSPIWMALLSASFTAASIDCWVTLSQADLRAFSRSLGWIPRTCATVPAPEVPPAQACANRCTVTSHFSPRLPSEQFSSGSTSSWVASVISFFSRLAQEAPSGRIPRRLTVLTT